jgi:drug/metabolite transporter (DMT)-like permease
MLLGGGAVLLWSTVATAFKLALRHLEPAQLLLGATVSSLLCLLVVLAVQGKMGRVARLRRDQLGRTALLGALNPFLYYVILFEAYDRLPAQVAQPLNYTWALTLSYLSIPLLQQRLRARDVVAGLVCYAGVVLISTGGRWGGLAFDGVGVALALGSTLVWALYWIGNARSDLDPVVGLFWGFLFALPLVAAWCALTVGLDVGGAPGLVGVLYVGAVEMGFTFVLWLGAMRRTTSTARVANLIFLSPFLSLVFIRWVLGEAIQASTPAGLVLIVAGLLWQQGGRRKAAAPASPA